MSLACLISCFKTGTYTVTRQDPGVWVSGSFVNGAVSTFPVDADVQPATGRDLKILSEGDHSEEILIVLTDTELRTESTRPNLSPPDTIEILSETYKVIRVQAPKGLGGDYYRSTVAKVIL